MGRAKDIIVKPISGQDARRIVRALHYSGKVVQNSQVHLGVFLDGKCGGALQFGPSMRRDLIAPLVEGTLLRDCIELNRMALADWMPRNGESRCISVSMRFLKRNYPWLKWVVSFADGCQCGDGTIYRASGFVLTGIKKNNGLRINPGTEQVMQSMAAFHKCESRNFSKWERLHGFQLRYIYFLDPTARKRLTVPEIPFSEIGARGAGMYLGKPRAGSIDSDAAITPDGKGGANPTPALCTSGAEL